MLNSPFSVFSLHLCLPSKGLPKMLEVPLEPSEL